MKSKVENDVAALILCAGSGSRTGLAHNKILHTLGTKTVLEMTLDAFISVGIENIVLAVAEKDEAEIREITSGYSGVSICRGGSTRTQSVRNGLNALPHCDIVVIHDGARPYVTADIIERSIESARAFGSGIAAIPVTDTVRQIDGDKTVTLDRDKLFRMQTPQTFRFDEIKAAYDSMKSEATDDAEIYLRAGYTPKFISGSEDNKKITTPSDLFGFSQSGLRIGVGFDVHELKENRALILCGVKIPFEKGLYGHSDADVAVHAIMDALLSAVGLPDIGVLFPDTDEKYTGADSMKLLRAVMEKVKDSGYRVSNISAVIMAQRPKLAGYIRSMRESIASAVGAEKERVNISATTTERLGIIGEGKGMAASASCLVEKIR